MLRILISALIAWAAISIPTIASWHLYFSNHSPETEIGLLFWVAVIFSYVPILFSSPIYEIFSFVGIVDSSYLALIILLYVHSYIYYKLFEKHFSKFALNYLLPFFLSTILIQVSYYHSPLGTPPLWLGFLKGTLDFKISYYYFILFFALALAGYSFTFYNAYKKRI